jgi:hypothetical protein
MHHHSSLTGLNYLISIRAVFASGTRHEAQAPHEVEGRQHRQRGWPSIIGEATWPLRQKKSGQVGRWSIQQRARRQENAKAVATGLSWVVGSPLLSFHLNPPPIPPSNLSGGTERCTGILEKFHHTCGSGLLAVFRAIYILLCIRMLIPNYPASARISNHINYMSAMELIDIMLIAEEKRT